MNAPKLSLACLPSQDLDVVFGAGGVKGVAHIGAVRFLEEQHVSVGRVTGASVGSLIAAFYANGYTADQMQAIFLAEDFRYPSWDVWAKVLHLWDPWTWYTRMFSGGLLGAIDFGPWLKDIVAKYQLKPQKSLRIVAADAFTHKPVAFEGTDYDLVEALTASTAVAGMMQPVWYTGGNHSDPLSGHGCPAMFGHLLVDGVYYHPTPAALCKAPALAFKIGFATQMPSERLSAGDLMLHMREMALASYFNATFPDPEGHLIVEVGVPDVAGLTFGLSQRKLEQMVAYGYEATAARLDESKCKAGV